METNAKYVSIGLFTLFAIAGMFGFIYWMHSTGGIGQRAMYRVKFQDSVAGLLTGSSVLFNGVRVGSVTALELDPENPDGVFATIAVSRATPVRNDTIVGLDFQGLTAAPVVALTGATATAPLLVSSGSDIPVLVAPAGSSRSLTQSARDTLGQLDKILSDNAAPLHDAIGNISTFSQALSRNSDRVDGIMSGLEKLTGGGSKARSVQYSLTAPTDVKQCATASDIVLVVPEPGGLLGLNSDKIPVIGSETPPDFARVQFTDNLTALVQAKTIQSLENTRCFKSVSRSIDGVEPDAQIVLDIRDFNIVLQPAAEADVDISAKYAAGGKIASSQAFRESVPLSSNDGTGAATTLDAAFGKAMRALTAWAAGVAAANPHVAAEPDLPPPPPPPAPTSTAPKREPTGQKHHGGAQ